MPDDSTPRGASPTGTRPSGQAAATIEVAATPPAPAADKTGPPTATGPAIDPDADRGAWRRAMLAGLWIWLGTRVALAVYSTTVWIREWDRLGAGAIAYKWSTQFDSWYFLTIAKEGYVRTPDEAYAAFFPVYPALVRLLTPVCAGKSWLAALTIANLALLAALVVLYRLAEHEMGRPVASRSIFYLVAFPTGFFLTAAYNGSLFLALLVGSVYAMRRGRWWIAGLIGAVACGTRSSGLLLVLPFAYEYLRVHGRRLRLDVIAGAFVPLGLGAVMIVDYVYFDDPLAFSHAQSAHWGRRLDWPWVPFYDALATMAHQHGVTETWIHNALELGTMLLLIVTLVLAMVGPWRMRRDQLVLPLFGLVLVLFMVSFPTRMVRDIPYPLMSTSRIGLEVFPAFLMLGRIARPRWVEQSMLVAFLTIQGQLAAHFLHGHWIA